jgi:hypothetical protein
MGARVIALLDRELHRDGEHISQLSVANVVQSMLQDSYLTILWDFWSWISDGRRIFLEF